MNDNPNATPAELEAGAKQALGEEQGEQPATEPVSDFEDIKQRIQTAKDSNFSNDEIKEAIKNAYTEDELFVIAKKEGYARVLTGRKKDIERMLNDLLK